jgi:glycerol-3-phosphate cytidylyltransferase
VKKYKIGYVPGVFDLFHIGHLNLFRNCKERCEYLIAGVLIDELVILYKKKAPYIPFEERFAIVEAIKYVDKVVPVTYENTEKFDAWKMYHYDCHFSGSDHCSDWKVELQQLKEVGSNMEFLPYTESTSSTAIKKLIEKSLL